MVHRVGSQLYLGRSRMEEVPVTEHEAGQRLDRFLRKLLRDVPLGAIFRHLRTGAIRVDGKKVDGDLRLAAGMRITLRLPPDDIVDALAAEDARAPAAPDPRVPAPRIVKRDEHVLVIDKPAGLATHGGTGIKHSVVDWLKSQRVGVRTGTFRPAPAHRLDRGTSGLLVIGLTPEALRGLTEAFRKDVIEKVYLAIVHGVPDRDSGSVVAPLWQDPAADARDAKVVVDPRGRPSRTDWEVSRAGRHMTLLRVVPRGGFTHQIRAHLAHAGHAIVGDRRYGSVADTGPGFLLHAAEIAFPHPITGKGMHCSAKMPTSFTDMLAPE